MQKKVWITLGAAVLIACAFVSGAWAAEENWPTWRGEGLLGVAAGKADPPVTWSESENVKWKVPIDGRGVSSPVIWGDRLFLLTAIDTGRQGETPPKPAAERPAQNGGRRRRRGPVAPTTLHDFVVLCINRTTGKEIWRKTVATVVPHEGHHPDHGYASYSPVTDGKHVYASFGSRGVYCLDMDGNLRWSDPLSKMQKRMGFGEGSSPALVGNALIVVMDHQGGSSIVAFNKLNGEKLWKTDRDEQSNWTTPLVVSVADATQVIVNGTKRIRSYNPADGKLIWECGGQTANAIPSPVAGLGMVFVTSGFRGSALQAIDPGRTGDLTGTDAVRWEVAEGTPYVPSPLLYEGKVYVYAVNKPVLSCYEARTGTPFYKGRKIEGMTGVYASPVGAAGRVYLAGRGGKTAVIANAESFELLALNALDDSFTASPAVIGKEIYLRGTKNLYCIARP